MSTIHYFSPDDLLSEIDTFCDMLKVTVDNGASIGWVIPFTLDEAKTYWQGVAQQIAGGNKVLIVAKHGDAIAGAVQLALEPRENGNHRGEVQKLMVHSDFRRQGIARMLMKELDVAAKKAKRTLLVLDVKKGEPAEMLYQQEGFIHVGDIPKYARSPYNTGLDATAYYYKLLE